MKAYLKEVWAAFKGSFARPFPYTFALAYEILFVLVIAGLMVLSRELLYGIATGLGGINPYSVDAATASAVKEFFVQSVLTMVGFLAVVFIAYLILQALVWLQVFGIRPTRRFALLWALANLAWWLPWAVVLWFVIAGLKANFAVVGVVIIGILFTHHTLVFQHEFIKDHGLKSAIGRAFSIGIGGIHKFILPYLLAAIVFILWSQVWNFVPVEQNSGFAVAALGCIVFAPFLAWWKFYMHKLLVSFG